MSTEFELYEENVPHGEPVLAFGDWSSTQTTITATASVGKTMYISSVGFIIDDAATITTGYIDITNNSVTVIKVDQAATVSEDVTKLFAFADPFSLKFMKIDASNEVIIGEIRFNPPVQVIAGNDFSIEASSAPTFAITPGAVGPFFTIKGWEDTPTT